MSKIEVNTVDVQCGSTLTLGSSGKTVQIACGASTSGMGRTGTVDWCTTAKTSPFTGVSGKGYFVNTTSGAITVTLPASPSAGDIIAVSDYASTWDSNSITLCRNSSKINGACKNTSISNEGAAVTLVYVDSTRGWKQVNDGTLNVTGQPNYVVASGGDTTITDGDYKIHVFTSDGNLSVSNAGNPNGNGTLEYFVVAGGGGGGRGDGSGGGAGGFRYFSALSPAGSPLVAPAGITATVATHPITVGAGGAGSCGTGAGCQGANSIFSTITSAGGGGGGSNPNNVGGNGGSGGGAPGSITAGTGNTPPTSPPQGQNGTAGPSQGGGGGGAGGVGGPSPGTTGGKGGLGSYIADGFVGPTAPSYGTPGPVGSTRYFSGGAGGHGDSARGPAPDGGGGGQGALAPGCGATDGTANTGGGGGGAQPGPAGKNGGSGIVFIRYKFQN
jgi:hypothetical protein